MKISVERARLFVREISGLTNLNIRKKLMTPEDHKREVQSLKDGVLASALAKVFNCGDELKTLTEKAFVRATRSGNAHIQGRISEASVKLKEFQEIMDDPQIRAFVDPENELPDAMKEALKRSQSEDG